jgi:hypothetical protein
MSDDDARILKPLGPVIAVTLAVDCPSCGERVEYHPDEDDAGAFTCVEEWPVCALCDAVIDVPPLRLVPVASTYFAGRLK